MGMSTTTTAMASRLLILCWILCHRMGHVSPLAFAAPMPFPEGEGPDGTKYKTAYRCEGEEMSISCDSTETIQVIRANYGRFSIAICNKHGYTDWSVNCMSPRTTRVLQNKCDGKRTCRMNVNSNVFGDPCPGTNKYVEVHYACSPQFTTTTTRRPLPPWFLENGADTLWINPRNSNPISEATSKTEETPETKASVVPSSPTTTLTTSTASEQEPKNIFSISASSAIASNAGSKRKPILVTGSDAITTSTTPIRIPITTPRPTTSTTTQTTTKASTVKPTTASTTRPTTLSTTVQTSEPTDLKNPKVDLRNVEDVSRDAQGHLPDVQVVAETEPTALVPDACQPTFARGINWNWTRSGDVAIVPCPNGATGLARWACLEDGHWSAGHNPAYPDLSDCKSAAIVNLEARVREEDPEDVVVSTLAHLTSKMATRLFGGDLESAVAILRTVANRLQYLLQTQSDSFYNKESYVQQVFQNVLRSASNLLSDESKAIWWDLHPSQRMKTATSLLLALEENAFLLAEVTNSPEIIQETSNSIVMAISILDVEYIKRSNGTSFPHKRPDYQSAGKYQHQNNQETEENWWARWPENNAIHLSKDSLLDYASEGSLTKAVFFAHGKLHKILGDADKHLKNNPGIDDMSSHTLNSFVISSSLGHGRHIQLKSPVRITLGHLRTNFTDPVCAFWDYELNGWSDSCCRMVTDLTGSEMYRDDVTICECDHLTNFGLLMRPSFVDRATGASLSNGGSPMNPSTVRVLEIVTYVAVGLSLVFLVIIIYRYHSKIQRLMLKYNCMGANDTSKKQDKVLDGCAKSQSFYSGMNQLVHVAAANHSTNTTTTTSASPGTCKPGDMTRVRNTVFYNCCGRECHQQTNNCPTSPSTSVTSTTSLSQTRCSSHDFDCTNLPVFQSHLPLTIVRLPPNRWQQPPHLQQWGPREEVIPQSSPYIYSSAYDFENTSPISQFLARQDLAHQYPGLSQSLDQDTEDEVANYQPYLSLTTPSGGHITTNPYDLRQESATTPDGLVATQHLRDAVYMSSQLVNLTNTLRGSSNKKKMMCQGGHSAGPCHHSRRESLQDDGDLVFRAVSPHGHVYWEIDPSRSDKIKMDPVQPQQEFVLSSMSRQSSSRYSDNYPLIGHSPAKSSTDSATNESAASAETMILVNPFADVQLISINNGHLSSSPASNGSPAQVRPNDVRFSSLRGQQKHQQRHLVMTPASHYQHFGTRATSTRAARMKDVVNTVEQWRAAQTAQGAPPMQTCSGSLSSSDGSTAIITSASSSSTSPTCQQNDQQVQIKDLRSVPVKSTDYILAKIHNQFGRSTPLDNSPVGGILNRSSPKQRKV